jgi:hypothetical protein
MKSKGDIDFVESSIENARAQVTNVEKVTRTLESLHNEMHDFEVRESVLKLTLNLIWWRRWRLDAVDVAARESTRHERIVPRRTGFFSWNMSSCARWCSKS